MSNYIDIVFDGPPEHEAGRFVEVEDDKGRGMSFGEWVQRDDGYWALRIHRIAALEQELAEARAEAIQWKHSAEKAHGALGNAISKQIHPTLHEPTGHAGASKRRRRNGILATRLAAAIQRAIQAESALAQSRAELAKVRAWTREHRIALKAAVECERPLCDNQDHDNNDSLLMCNCVGEAIKRVLAGERYRNGGPTFV